MPPWLYICHYITSWLEVLNCMYLYLSMSCYLFSYFSGKYLGSLNSILFYLCFISVSNVVWDPDPCINIPYVCPALEKLNHHSLCFCALGFPIRDKNLSDSRATLYREREKENIQTRSEQVVCWVGPPPSGVSEVYYFWSWWRSCWQGLWVKTKER